MSVVKKGLPVADNHGVAFVHQFDGPKLGVDTRSDRSHRDGGQHPCLTPCILDGRLQGQRINHCREHPHLVAAHAVEALADTAHPAEDVTAADDDADLDAAVGYGFDLFGIGGQHLRVEAVALLSLERFAAQFEEYPFVLGHGVSFG